VEHNLDGLGYFLFRTHEQLFHIKNFPILNSFPNRRKFIIFPLVVRWTKSHNPEGCNYRRTAYHRSNAGRNFLYQGDDKSLARPASRCILMVRIFRLMLVLFIYIYIHIYIIYTYRVSREECKKLQQSVPYVKIYRYNPKHLHQKLNGYGDKGQRKVWSTSGFHTLYLPADSVSMPVLQCGIILHLTISL
jgi:hypothetical protein